MNAKTKLFSYDLLDTTIHKLSGLTKLICFLFLTFAVMYSYDIRVILFITVFSILMLWISRIKFRQIRTMVLYVAVFILTNTIISFLFAPEMGVEIYGTRHNIAKLYGGLYLTQEQLFYTLTKMVKYASVVPLGMIFLLTTNPSEFASSLNRVGVPYKASYARGADPALLPGYPARLPRHQPGPTGSRAGPFPQGKIRRQGKELLADHHSADFLLVGPHRTDQQRDGPARLW